MRIVSADIIREKLKELAIKANTHLRPDVLILLKEALSREKKPLSMRALTAIIDNAAAAKKEKLAICQDTGFPIVFLEIGSQVQVKEGITGLINEAVRDGYLEGYLRASVQKDPIFRKAKLSYEPCIVHTDIVRGNKIKITLFPKGFGSENKAKIKMFNPTARINEIEDFIVTCVREAGADACPPYVVGVGIGGTQDFASLLAKRALLSPITRKNPNKNLAALEQSLFKKINNLGIGPFGFGGRASVLAVKVKTYPTHIAGMPVAVNISCHALRSASVTI